VNGRERILAAMRGQPADGRLPLIPISMMVAAHTIGEPYGKYIHDARVHAAGQIAFAERWDVDHVSAISCPTTEAADLGAHVIYYDDQPPAIDEREAFLSDKARLATAGRLVPGARCTKRLETLRLLREGVAGTKLVEGWVEGPCAEACDLRGINSFMMDLLEDPDFVRDLLAYVFENAMAYARLQKEAGAEIMGVGDAASSLVGPDVYAEYIWEWQKRYVEALHGMGLLVRLHICGNTTPLLAMLHDVPADILDLDFMVPMERARAEVGEERFLSGNIDPVRVLRNGTPADVAHGFAACWNGVGRQRYAVNAGCEVPRDTPLENLAAMRDFAWSPSAPERS
jgi:MtaA/CmuA family methyltransferase